MAALGKRASPEQGRSEQCLSSWGPLAAYAVTLAAFAVASFFPEYRIWGFSIWAHLPTAIPFLLGAGGVAVIVVVVAALRRKRKGIDIKQAGHMSDRTYYLLGGGLAVLLGFAFYLFRARLHFLGDGYTLLSLLADHEPLIKGRELGEALLHVWLTNLLPGDAQQKALGSFQVISIAAGALLVISSVLVSKKLFNDNRSRLLFLLGVSSGGYMLLFFGYVENYSVFVLSVSIYCLLGLLIARDWLSPWWLLPAQAVAAILHILGAALLPATTYLLLSKTGFGHRLGRLDGRVKWLWALVTVITGGCLFLYVYRTDYFFRFAVVPLLENAFTLEGYTLFSAKHLLDVLNLVFILVPGLVVLLAGVSRSTWQKVLRERGGRFLLIGTVASIGAVFILDPKLGMPRDWDLFSFAGIPMAHLLYYVLLNGVGGRVAKVRTAALAISCGLLSLSPRVISQIIPASSVGWFQDYTSLDKVKSKNPRTILVDYYENRGMDSLAQVEIQRWEQDYPEKAICDMGEVLKSKGRLDEAMEAFRRAATLNPGYTDPWQHLGECYLRIGSYDSALTFLQIARGLNPYNDVTYNNLGVVYLFMRRLDDAEKMYLTAEHLGDTSLELHTNLEQLYRLTGDEERRIKYLKMAASHENVAASTVAMLGDWYLEARDYDRAASAYRRALEKGLDSGYVTTLRQRFPQLDQEFSQP